MGSRGLNPTGEKERIKHIFLFTMGEHCREIYMGMKKESDNLKQM